MSNTTSSASALSQFEFQASKPVRVIVMEGEPWFVAGDVCLVLDIVNTTRALSRLDDDEKGLHTVNTPGGDQEMNIINESGLYSLILTSRKPEAKQFKKWVTAEVLPAIRKTGRYQYPAPQPQHEAHELMTGSDMQNLTRLVWLMSHHFRHKDSVTQAIWFAFRACTNTPAPQRFQTRHIPLLAAEARRMFYLTRAVAELTAEAEKTLVKRIIRKGENAEKVIEEMRVALQKANDDDLQTADRYLGKWVEHEIRPLVERNQNPGAFYPECAERAVMSR